jgi:hypothetical protein
MTGENGLLFPKFFAKAIICHDRLGTNIANFSVDPRAPICTGIVQVASRSFLPHSKAFSQRSF